MAGYSLRDERFTKVGRCPRVEEFTTGRMIFEGRKISESGEIHKGCMMSHSWMIPEVERYTWVGRCLRVGRSLKVKRYTNIGRLTTVGTSWRVKR